MNKTNKGKEQKGTDNFFTEIFIDKKRLEENNINYPIKLEYYKIKNAKNEYGVEIVKKEYRNEFTKVENEKITEITKEENIINALILKLKENFVTPVGLRDILEELNF